MKDRKYGDVFLQNRPETASSNEPCIMLRAQDLYAEAAIRFYATLVAAGGNAQMAEFAMKTADEFAKWRGPKKRPD